MEIILILFWLISFGVYVLTQLYWWQIKEYRLDRFLVHLQTNVGKKLYLSPVNLAKLTTFALLLALPLAGFWMFVMVYTLLAFKCTRDLLKTLPRPVLTLRMIQIILTFALLNLTIYFILNNSFFIPIIIGLVVLDLLSPVLIGGTIFLSGILIFCYKQHLFRKAARKIEKLPNLKIIGVTGSFGKTTTKDFIATILEEKFSVQKTPEHVNTELGISKFVLNNLSESHEIFVVELAAYKKGEIARMCRILKPNIGVLTAIGISHLALFGSERNILNAKFELIDSLPQNGVAILNGDDPKIVTNSQKYNFKKVFFSAKKRVDIWASQVAEKPEGLSFKLNIGKSSYFIQSPIIGGYNILNILAAVSVASELGMVHKDILEGIKKLKSPSSTMEVLESKNGSIIIDDSYNINPTGVSLALDSLSYYPRFKKILILSPMLELGTETEKSHQVVLKKALAICDSVLWVGLDLVNIVKKFQTGEKLKIFKTSMLALKYIKEYDLKNTVFLCEGRNAKAVVEALL